MRCLYTIADDELFAYETGRRDFVRSSDETLWAHESHDWLVSAVSGEPLAHRTGDIFYGVEASEPLYRMTEDDTRSAPPAPSRSDAPSERPRLLKSSRRVHNARS
jgi:hypothetical protein